MTGCCSACPWAAWINPHWKQTPVCVAGSRPFASYTFHPGGDGLAFIKTDLGFSFIHLPSTPPKPPHHWGLPQSMTSDRGSHSTAAGVGQWAWAGWTPCLLQGPHDWGQRVSGNRDPLRSRCPGAKDRFWPTFQERKPNQPKVRSPGKGIRRAT